MKKEDYTVNGVALDEIKNQYELTVIKQMRKVLAEFPEFDNCQLCIEDVYALSLSRIPPVYVQRGSIVLQKEMSNEDVADIVKYAVYQVMDRPRHG